MSVLEATTNPDLHTLLACRAGEGELIQFQVRGFRAESCAVHLGTFAGALEVRNFPLLLGCSGSVAPLWALLRLGTAEPWCCSVGERWFPPRTCVWHRHKRVPWSLWSSHPKDSTVWWLVTLALVPVIRFTVKNIYGHKGAVQDLAAHAGQSSLCVKHTKVIWDAPGGFVKVLFADHYKYIIFSGIEKAH